MGVSENLVVVRDSITRACARAGRDPRSVTLVGVSKTFPAASVVEAVRAGLTDIGENWVQEAAPKVAEVMSAGCRPTWHLIGHLQSNKVKQALAIFDQIDSVDSLHLAEALSKRANRSTPVLVEVNVGGEPTKFGVAPPEVPEVVTAIQSMPNLDVRGLMTVAPAGLSHEELRTVFGTLRSLRDSLGLRDLSMGMSDDYEIAIEEGSTIVRLGRAIFGARTYPQHPQPAGAGHGGGTGLMKDGDAQ